MTWVYMSVLGILLIFMMLCRNYKREYFKKLNRKEHPLKIIYPLCARVLDWIGKRFGIKGAEHAKTMLRSLHVKENVEKEAYIYEIKKGSVIICILFAAAFLATVLAFMEPGAERIGKLIRGAYGQGVTDYELEYSYKGDENAISIGVDEVKLNESEILELFERSYEGVRKEMLGDNSSCEEVNKPVNLISGYNGFEIFWKIDDTGLIGYDGDIKAEISKGDKKVVNLFAVFSLDGVSQTFNYPVVLVSPDLGEQKELITRIIKEISKNNDAYSKSVLLPEEIDGSGISFHTISGNNALIIMLMAAAAIIAIILLYDKGLENKVNKRQDALMMDFARIVPKLSLLYDAGLSIHGAFSRIVSDHEKNQAGKKDNDYAYMEMKLALEKIRSGMGEAQAYSQFGKRCGLQPYIKLGNILEQNLSKGARGMQGLLDEEVKTAYEERKRIARKKGEQASTKMLMPMILMLLVVIVIIAFPALVSMNLR